MDYKDTIKEILLQIRRDMNGAVVGTMLEILGNERYVNYGVAVPTIKKTAKKYYPNHELALQMFSSEIRDLKIASIYIDIPSEVTLEQMRDWSSAFDEQDIIENACSMLFYKAEDALLIAEEWINTYPYASMLITAKHARFCFSADNLELYKSIATKITEEIGEEKFVSARCRMLAAIASAHNELEKFIDNLPLSDFIRYEVKSLTI